MTSSPGRRTCRRSAANKHNTTNGSPAKNGASSILGQGTNGWAFTVSKQKAALCKNRALLFHDKILPYLQILRMLQNCTPPFSLSDILSGNSLSIKKSAFPLPLWGRIFVWLITTSNTPNHRRQSNLAKSFSKIYPYNSLFTPNEKSIHPALIPTTDFDTIPSVPHLLMTSEGFHPKLTSPGFRTRNQQSFLSADRFYHVLRYCNMLDDR